MSVTRSGARRAQEEESSTATTSKKDRRSGDDDDRQTGRDQKDLASSTNSNSASNRRSSDSKRANRPKDDSDEQGNVDELNALTLEVVAKLKYDIHKKRRPTTTINECVIEKAVANIREENIEGYLDEKTWQKNLPEDVQNCPDRLLTAVRAYGDDLDRAATILREKINNPASNIPTDEDEGPLESSLGEGIHVLQRLKNKLKRPTSSGLCRAVLDINTNEIDRADRMFYIEASRLIGNGEYSYENAHDQVQAIRLMQFELDDDNELLRFIERCRNFNEAHLYLQKRARERVNKSEKDTTKTKNQFTKPLIRRGHDGQDDDTDKDSKPLYNSEAAGTPSLQQQSQRDQTKQDFGNDNTHTTTRRNSITKPGGSADDRSDPYYGKQTRC